MVTIRNTDQIVDAFFHFIIFLYFFIHFTYQPQVSLPPILSLHSHLAPTLLPSAPQKGLGLPWEVNKFWHIKLRQVQVPTPAEQGLPLYGMCFKKPDHAPGKVPSSFARGPTNQAAQLSTTFRRPISVSCKIPISQFRVHELPGVGISCLCGCPLHDLVTTLLLLI